MALDIAKLGRKPYQKLEQPIRADDSGAHIRRYFSSLFGRALTAALLFGAFAVPAWVWDFGLGAGHGRHTAARVLSGAVLVLFSWHVLFRRELSEPSRSVALPYRSVVGLALALVAAGAVGSVAHQGASGALGLGAPDAQLESLGLAFGAVWLIAVLYGRGTVALAKQLLVILFLGSTVLAAYVIYALLARGGYAGTAWVATESVPLFLSVVAFLMVAFAMFQKRSIKLLWTMSVLLHLAALFAWDAASAWLVLVAGISALLLFQIIYHKKLWQRNFTYPLQIWTIAALLLVIPVKLFTGFDVPESSVLSYVASRQAVSDAGFTLFGNGLSGSDERALISGISFDDFGQLSRAIAPLPVVGHGYFQLYLESGALGALAWLALLAAVFSAGVRFWRKHVKAFQEGTMSEGAYLGAIALVALVMLSAGLWFSPFSFLAYWLWMLLVAVALVLWHVPAGPAHEPSAPASSVRLRRASAALRVAVVAVTFAYFAFLVVDLRAASADKVVASLASQADPGTRALGWERAARLSPWNTWYRLSEARAFLDLLGTPISIDAQRGAIERVTAILSRETKGSDNPVVHWVAAAMYADLEAYAEGSSSLARAAYQRTRELWPESVALPVAIARFYRESADALLSGAAPAAELRLQARAGLEQSLALAPDYLPARLELAFLLEDEEGVAAALQELEPWEDASPEITYHIGRLYFNDREFEKASEKFLEVVRSVPSHSNARYSLGVAYFRLEKYVEALREFQEVLRLNPGSQDVQAKIEQVQERLGE